MALTSVRRLRELEGLLVLAPERYDPRRESLQSSAPRGMPLRQLVALIRKTVTAADEPGRRCLVLDASDVQEGIVLSRKRPSIVGEIGSSKKVVQPEDVIISRLRPYLRQVAFVDAKVRYREDDLLLLCSTEFFVLRPVDEQSIAFLVPFLLSTSVQQVLAASQEGGHHPRFNEASLLGLPVPAGFVKKRDEISRTVERGIQLYRESERDLMNMIGVAEATMGGGQG
jgi:hypothetical protein